MTPDLAELKRIARDTMFAALNTEAPEQERLGGWDDLEPALAEVLERVAAAVAAAVAAPLIARIEALEEGLKPFAEAAKQFVGVPEETAVAGYPATVADLRRAANLLGDRAALNPESKP